jgi:cholera toxin transcriptional activator
MGKVIIGENIEFKPERRVLCGGHEVVKLHSSSSYCFELLIAHHGYIVEHEAFYDFAWRRFGMEVSSNALYQSISILRKALSTCGNKEDIIITIPRRGFTLSKKIKILFEDDQSIRPDEDLVNEKKIEGEVNLSVKESVNGSHFIEAVKVDNNNHKISKYIKIIYSNKYKGGLVYLFMVLFFIFILFSSVVFLFPIKNNNLYFENKKLNGCFFYSDSKLDKENIMKVISAGGVKCSEKKYLYISSFLNGNRVSVVQCGSKISFLSRADCISYYYVKER